MIQLEEENRCAEKRRRGEGEAGCNQHTDADGVWAVISQKLIDPTDRRTEGGREGVGKGVTLARPDMLTVPHEEITFWMQLCGSLRISEPRSRITTLPLPPLVVTCNRLVSRRTGARQGRGRRGRRRPRLGL